MEPVKNKGLREVIKDYISHEQTKPMLIIGKTQSGRTSTIQEVVADMNYTKRDWQNIHISSGVDLKQCINTSAINSFEKMVSTQVPATGKIIVEVDLNSPYTTVDLWDRLASHEDSFKETWAYYLKSDKYIIVPYIPDVSDWIEWANGKVHDEVIRFARAYPYLYSVMPYTVYNRIDHDIRNRESSEHTAVIYKDGTREDFYYDGHNNKIFLGYTGQFYMLMNDCIDALFRRFIEQEEANNPIRKLFFK